MSRKTVTTRQAKYADNRFGCAELTKLINLLMVSGKKLKAACIVNKALTMIHPNRFKQLVVLQQAVNNVKPSMEIKTRRVGGANYKVPVEISPNRKLALALKWIKDAAKTNRKREMHVSLCNEILNAANKQGSAIRKRNEMHKAAETNKTFTHLKPQQQPNVQH